MSILNGFLVMMKYLVVILLCINTAFAADAEYEITEPSGGGLYWTVKIKIKSLEMSDLGFSVQDYNHPCKATSLVYCDLNTFLNGSAPGVNGVMISEQQSPKNAKAAAGLKSILASKNEYIAYIHKNIMNPILASPPVCLRMSYYVSYWPAVMGTISSCDGGLPPLPFPEPISCTMNDVVLEHGVINLAELDGHQTSKSSFVSCNGKGTGRVTVNISVLNNGSITLDSTGNLKSQIYVNGVAGGQSMTIPDNGALISIISKLTAAKGAMLNGSFQKSSTIVLSIL
ncbi:hypothetical protein [Serratia marcescens]|uniref:MrpH family fimbial adhesin n=1 Tax=Serratia marcescens TaxID=615 RepID=UPI0018D9F154|nr:hypothetical protein [Serratia marcescens]MBH2674379.1 hypothetical protein [Serratia marcescens]HBK4608746.1 hypothetical protein [Serratia marcescens]HBK4675149.1 hypothetical protein [Serratia marcescens]